MATYYFDLPLKDEDVCKLKLGDVVYLSGLVYTARDMGHLKIKEHVENGKDLPVDMKGAAIFHAGPVAIKNGEQWELSVIGPTTSIRMEPYAKMVGELGVKAIIGKGGMAADSEKCYTQYKQVYLQAPPGCAVKLGKTVREIKGVSWLEMGMPEALWQLDTDKFGPLVVTMDSQGNSQYKNLKEKAYEIMQGILDSK